LLDITVFPHQVCGFSTSKSLRYWLY